MLQHVRQPLPRMLTTTVRLQRICPVVAKSVWRSDRNWMDGSTSPPCYSAAAVVDTPSPGTLVIKDRVISRVVVAAALTVPSVARHARGVSRLAGKQLPRVDLSVGEHSVSVNLYVGLVWPCAIIDVAETIHDQVAHALDTVVGLPLHRLNILVAATVAAGTQQHQIAQQSTVRASTALVVRPRPPTASPAALPVALILAVALLGVALVAGREWLIVHDAIGGAPWISNTVHWIAELHSTLWMIGAAATAVLLGLVLIVIGIKPRTKTHIGALSPNSTMPIVWLRPTDVARVCSEHASGVPGSKSVRTTVTKHRVTIEVRRPSGSDDSILAESVEQSVATTLATLADPRTVRVRFTEGTP